MKPEHRAYLLISFVLVLCLMATVAQWSENGRFYLKPYKNTLLVLDTRTGHITRQPLEQVPIAISEPEQPISDAMEAYIDGY